VGEEDVGLTMPVRRSDRGPIRLKPGQEEGPASCAGTIRWSWKSCKVPQQQRATPASVLDAHPAAISAELARSMAKDFHCAKRFVTEKAIDIVNHALTASGGSGYPGFAGGLRPCLTAAARVALQKLAGTKKRPITTEQRNT
jgi:hypothetical protein